MLLTMFLKISLHRIEVIFVLLVLLLDFAVMHKMVFNFLVVEVVGERSSVDKNNF